MPSIDQGSNETSGDLLQSKEEDSSSFQSVNVSVKVVEEDNPVVATNVDSEDVFLGFDTDKKETAKTKDKKKVSEKQKRSFVKQLRARMILVRAGNP